MRPALLAAIVAAWTLPHYTPQLNPVVKDPHAAFSWQYRMSKGTSTVPSVDGSTLFVAGNDDNVYALDLYTGAPKWHTALGNKVMTAPIVYKGIVIVASGGSTSKVWDPPDHIVVGTGENAIYGLRESDGAVLWRYPLQGTGMPGGALVNGLYVHHDGAGNVVALDYRTGKLVWKRYVRSAAAMSAIAPAGRRLLLSAGVAPTRVFALHENGKPAWSYDLPRGSSGVPDTPIATDARDFACTMYLVPQYANVKYVYVQRHVVQHLLALHAETGKKRWDAVLERGDLETHNWAAIPVLANGRIYIGSEVQPYVHAVDAATGRLLWKHRLGGLDQSAGVEKDGVYYVGDASGMLWAFNAATGQVIGTKKFRDGFRVGSPIIVGKTLIDGSNHGYVYAVPLNTILTSHDAA